MSLVEQVKDAVRQSSAELTSSLRRSAYYQGWDSQCGRSLKVNCDGESFSIDMSQKAEDAEFGWGAPPSPAVRRWSGDQASIEETLIQSVSKKLGAL